MELLTVVAVCGIIAAIAAPTYQIVTNNAYKRVVRSEFTSLARNASSLRDLTTPTPTWADAVDVAAAEMHGNNVEHEWARITDGSSPAMPGQVDLFDRGDSAVLTTPQTAGSDELLIAVIGEDGSVTVSVDVPPTGPANTPSLTAGLTTQVTWSGIDGLTGTVGPVMLTGPAGHSVASAIADPAAGTVTASVTSACDAMTGTASFMLRNRNGLTAPLPASVVRQTAGPVNDNINCATTFAVQAGALWASGTVDMATATKQTGESQVAITLARTLWWKFTAPADATVNLRATTSTNSVGAAVFSAENVTATPVTFCQANYPCNASFTATAGTTYWVRLGSGTSTGALTGTLTLWVSPGGNDDLAGATDIPITAGSLWTSGTVDLTYTTQQAGESQAWVNLARTAWWKFTAPSTGTVNVRGDVSSVSRAVAVFATPSVTATPVADCRYGGAACTASFTATAGTTYWVRLGTDTWTGALTGTLTLWVSPGGNDDLAGATDIPITAGSLWTSGTVDLTYTTQQAGESQAWVNLARTAWWKFTAPSTGTVNIRGDSSTVSRAVAVFATPSVTATPVATCGYGGAACIASFTATAGTTYWVRLGTDTWTGAWTGSLALWVSPGGNDDLASATAIAAVAGSTWSSGTVDLTYATRESAELPNMISLGRSVWWKFTAPSTGTVTATVNTSTGGRVATVLPSESLTATAVASCTYNGAACSTSFTATAGTTYWIRLGSNTWNGALSGSLTVTFPP